MPRNRRDSYSDDDSYDSTPPRRHGDRREDRRDDSRDRRRDDPRDRRRDDPRERRRGDPRDLRRDDPRDRRRDDPRDHRRDDRRDERPDRRSRVRRYSSDLSETAPATKRKIPTKVNRSCTDVFFLIIFLLILVAWLATAFIICTRVDLGSLVANMLKDGQNETCGVGDLKEQKFLYIHNFKEGFRMNGLLPKIDFSESTERWCVKKCPDNYIDFEKMEFLENADALVCFNNATQRIEEKTDSEKIDQLEKEIDAKQCAPFVYPSYEILFFCIPDIRKLEKSVGDNVQEDSENSTTQASGGSTLYQSSAGKEIDNALDTITELVKPDTIVQIMLDIWASRLPILGGFAVALVLAFIWMLLMRFFAGIIVWVTTLLLPIVLGAFTALFTLATYRIWNDEVGPFDTLSITNPAYLWSRYEFRAAVSSLFGLLFLLSVLLILFLRKRIRIAVALIKQASRSISNLPTLVILPIFPYILQAAGVALGVLIYFLISAVRSKPESEEADFHQACTKVAGDTIDTSDFCLFIYSALRTGPYVHIFNVFCTFWFVMFIGAFGYMVVAHAVARYFWTHKAEDSQCMAVGASVGTTTRYHLGTIAFGSLIVAIVSVIRVVLEWFQGKTKADRSSVANCIAKCCLCCFYLLEKFLKYLNKNAYIMVAMYGKNFCWSAGKAFGLIVSNALRVLVVTKLTDFVIFVAKVVTSACAAIILYFIYENDSLRASLKLPDLFSVFVPVVATGTGSFIVTSCFFNVYRSTVDTLFLCFLEDKKINDGSRERPYRMSSELKKIFDKKNHR